ncbi:hypothetical protein [Dysgonomonas gadei]|uniref:hypothetical protein n=1 Tax=Dysgonomonas gadei TaxID=156974 RepID=UPI003AF08137
MTDSLDIFINGHRGVLFRWSFDIDIPQKLSNNLFLFGTSELRLPLWSTDLDDNTFIVLDLDAFLEFNYGVNK